MIRVYIKFKWIDYSAESKEIWYSMFKLIFMYSKFCNHTEHPNFKYKTMALCKISLNFSSLYKTWISESQRRSSSAVVVGLLFSQKSSLMKFLKNAGSEIPIKKGWKKNAWRILF